MWGYDLRNQLVADVFYDEGREFIKFTNGKEITVETAWRWGWERVLQYLPADESDRNQVTTMRGDHRLPVPINQHPIHNRNTPLRIFRQQFLDHDHKCRIIPTLLQEFKPRILP